MLSLSEFTALIDAFGNQVAAGKVYTVYYFIYNKHLFIYLFLHLLP